MKRKRNLKVGDGLVAVGSTRTLDPARREHGRPSGNAVHLTHRTMDVRLIARKTGFPDRDLGARSGSHSGRPLPLAIAPGQIAIGKLR